MGDARNNPNSSQYRGPLPEFIIQPVLGHRFRPTAEWLEANKDAIAAGTPPEPKPEDCNLEIVVCAGMAYPSHFIEQRNWKQGVADVQVIGTMPFSLFKAAVDAQIAQRSGEAAPAAAAPAPADAPAEETAH